MKRLRVSTFLIVLSMLAGGVQAEAKSWRATTTPAKRPEAQVVQAGKILRDGKIAQPRQAEGGRSALIGSTDTVFPHLAIGGYWETEVVVMNMGSTTVTFHQYFYDQAGNPLTVTIRSLPDGQTETTPFIEGTLNPGERFTFLLSDQGATTKIGWSYLEYDTTNQRLGGFAVFRTFGVPNRPDLEAVVPLSAIDDFIFFMPYDNMDGFTTTMALVNGSENATNQVTAIVLDQEARELERKTITLTPGEQRAFALTDIFPSTRNQIGSVYFEGSFDLLSALGFRFNPGGAFTTFPVLNWLGNFQ